MTPLESDPADDAARKPGARQTQRKQADALVGAPASVDGLTALALAYLAFPNLIFLFGWFRLPIALLLCSAMIYFIARVFRPWPAVWRSQHAWSAVILLIVTSGAWAAFGGGSHFMYANPDWYIRDAVLGDLVNAEWPAHYLAADGTPLILRSAIGYFLPLALFGKLFGLAHLDLAVYAWTTLGVLIFLLMLPLPRRVGSRLALDAAAGGLLQWNGFSWSDHRHRVNAALSFTARMVGPHELPLAHQSAALGTQSLPADLDCNSGLPAPPERR
jgi:hypothetical protein